MELRVVEYKPPRTRPVEPAKPPEDIDPLSWLLIGLLKIVGGFCLVALNIALVGGMLYGLVWLIHAMWRAT